MSGQIPYISICIPSFHRPGRPGNLLHLLKTVDAGATGDVEIVVCDDKSPNIGEVRSEVERFKKETRYEFRYFENPENVGYDKNLKELITHAKGEWIMFMGDDDEFVPGALDKLIDFLKVNSELGYVLKSHLTVRAGGVEKFRYWAGNRFFPPGQDTLAALFRKSVFISGFTVRRAFLPPPVSDFDDSLLYQHYLLGEVVLKHPSAYFDEPLTRQYDDSADMPTESGEYKPHATRTPSIETSVRFLKSFLLIPEYFDKKYGTKVAPAVRRDMSKYFYPTLSVHRGKGLGMFFRYVGEMNRLGYNITPHYRLYVLLLAIFGKNACDWGIMRIKALLGRTPKL